MLLMCASVYEEILEAQFHGHTNIYLNYRKLSELPEELLTLSKIEKLYLKRNVLKKLVRSLMHATLDMYVVFNLNLIDLLHWLFFHFCTSASRYLETWKFSRTVSMCKLDYQWIAIKSTAHIDTAMMWFFGSFFFCRYLHSNELHQLPDGTEIYWSFIIIED